MGANHLLICNGNHPRVFHSNAPSRFDWFRRHRQLTFWPVIFQCLVFLYPLQKVVLVLKTLSLSHKLATVLKR